MMAKEKGFRFEVGLSRATVFKGPFARFTVHCGDKMLLRKALAQALMHYGIERAEPLAQKRARTAIDEALRAPAEEK